MAEKERAVVTNQLGWHRAGTIDATAAGSDVALAKTERFYSTALALTNSVAIEVNPNINGIEIRVLFSTNNHTGDIDIWAARDEDDNLVQICTWDAVAGDQDSDDGKKYCDTLTISNEEGWPKKPKTKVTGVDYIARTLCDLCGHRKVIFHGYGTFNSDAIIEVSGY